MRLAYHAAPMRARPTALLVVLGLLVVSVLASCTSNATTDSTPPPTTSSTSVSESPIPSGPIDFVPGEYELDESDVTAKLTWNGGTGSLEVTNHSPDELGAPTLYAVTQDERVVDATVDGEAIASGDTATVDVVFPDDLTLPDVGLMILGFGDISYGVMPPVLVET
jgi:hypothetical protein